MTQHYRITNQHKITTMSAKHPPAAYAASGDIVVFETMDCFDGTVTREDQHLTAVGQEHINPATGPLYIEGAKAGDILKIEILDIQVANSGLISDAPGHGYLADFVPNEATRIIPIEKNVAILSKKVKVPIRPMIGVIGTAPPAGEEIATNTPGRHGSNLDCKKITKGTTLYLPVYIDGALLAMGDVHAIMGDGEIIVCGLEVCGEVTVRVTVLPTTNIPLPFLVTKKQAIVLCSAPSLDEAAKEATLSMQKFLMDQVGMDFHEAGMLLSMVGNLRICQVVNPLVTVRFEFPRRILKKYGYHF